METKKFPKWAILVGVLLILVIWVMSGYNSLVAYQNDADKAWAQVETDYQRRFDLVPQLVGTVQGAADFEKSTLTAVTEARTQWLNTTANASAGVGERAAAASNFESALSRLLVSVEAYPQLRATEAFQTLQAQLEGTENRIAVSRKDYNTIAADYNLQIRRFPRNLLAGAFGFDKYPLFDANPQADQAPVVEFK